MAQRRRQSASSAACPVPSSSRDAMMIDVPEVRLDDEDVDLLGLHQKDGRTDSALHPAAQHPLYATTSPVQSSFARAQSYQRRRKNAADPVTGPRANGRSRPSDDQEVDKKLNTAPQSKLSTLDRLEGWFGLQSSASSDPRHITPADRPSTTSVRSRAGNSATASSQKSKSSASATVTNNKTSRLVLVHLVLASDSLEGLALRYNTDVRTLRRANGLWPGDSVQVRKEIYIPVDEDAAQGAGTGGRRVSGVVHQASEEANGKLSLLLNGQHHLLGTNPSGASPHTRSLSVTSASSSGATSQSQTNSTAAVESTSASSARLSPPELRRIPAQSLSHFPPPGSNTGHPSKGKGRETEGLKEPFGYGLGLQPFEDEELQPGESGVEDLLQLAERARLRGSSSIDEVAADQGHRPTLARARSSQVLRSDRDEAAQSVAASSPALSLRALDEDWKPNKWTLGQSGKRHTPSSLNHKSSYSTMSASDRPDHAGGDVPPPPISAAMKARASQGWNDIPEPPLSKTAKGQVAHAYKPKRRYPRPGAGGVDMPGSALMEDLAAGLPPNPGPASNWARPIGDSLPLPAEETHRRSISKSGAGSGAAASSAGWGQILSDTVRGKMRLEDALGRGIDDIRAGLSGTTLSSDAGLAGPDAMRTRPHAVQQAAVGQRPSAELARAKLSDPIVRPPPRAGTAGERGAAGAADQANSPASYSTTLDIDASAALRRSSGRSLHELEDLRVQHNGSAETSNTTAATAISTTTQPDVYPATSTGHSTTSNGESATSNREAVNGTGGGGGINRRNAQKVDWLG